MAEKKNYRIAIDINDTLRDFTRQFIKVYNRFVDPQFLIDYEEVNDFDFFNVFPFPDENGFNDRDLYYKFKYEDCSYELYARAEVMERGLIAKLSLWLQNTMTDFNEDMLPEIFLVCPLEMNLSIQSTLSFLAKMGCRFREIVFPKDSHTIWDNCDMLITANPELMEIKPEGKVAVKINAPYNKEVKADYTFDTMSEVIDDENSTITNIIEKYNNAND